MVSNDQSISFFLLLNQPFQLASFRSSIQSLSRSAWKAWEPVTMIPCLTKDRLSIHLLHRQACLNSQYIYIDPESRLQVLTRYAHLQRGKCCGNQCRHCPYGHMNAEINFSRPQKIFNTSYYE
ncbi:unnamed protein product [Rotaria sp. Silwood2]|nr:unnamed protein product [Rotaria sp. Silwood2]